MLKEFFKQIERRLPIDTVFVAVSRPLSKRRRRSSQVFGDRFLRINSLLGKGGGLLSEHSGSGRDTLVDFVSEGLAAKHNSKEGVSYTILLMGIYSDAGKSGRHFSGIFRS